MGRFRVLVVRILVVMDVVVRGLDIFEVKMVINYDILRDLDDYIYCVGCIVRVGRKGDVVMFVG